MWNDDVGVAMAMAVLTVPLRARCMGFRSGETLIRPELPA